METLGLSAWHQGQPLVAIGPGKMLRLYWQAHEPALEPGIEPIAEMGTGRVTGLSGAGQYL
ncbi:hypothetical protein D3C79_585510 [compost metagenome]